MRTRIAEFWSQIERWLSIHVPAAIPVLPPGAANAAFIQAETTLQYELPAELKEFLAVHDGSAHLWLHDYGEFMSLSDMLAAWDQEFDLWGDGSNDEWAAPQGPIKRTWFTRKWLPIINARTGDYVCIDLDPPQDGKCGQLITWFHDGGPTEVLAPSLADLLADFVRELEVGRYTPRIDKAGRPYLHCNASA